MIEEKYYYHFFTKLIGICSNEIYLLKDYFGSLKVAWENFEEMNASKYCISKKIHMLLSQRNKTINQYQEIDLLKRNNIDIVSHEDPLYPKLLSEIGKPPLLLYTIGDKNLLTGNNFAIVGSRNCSYYGEKMVKHFISPLINHNFIIVSGLALGIDTLAHKNALREKGKTIAVLAGSVNCVYPKLNKKLYEQIANEGLLISEYPPLTFPRPEMFPIRNRIISGISLGTFIVEARAKSGALITGRLAVEQGREVFALPGSIESRVSQGTHQLIKNGEAQLVETPEEIIETLKKSPMLKILFPKNNQKNQSQLSELKEKKEKDPKIFENVIYPITIDELARILNLKAQELAIIISNLEIEGLIKKLPGNRIVKS